VFHYESKEDSNVTSDNEGVRWWYEWRDPERKRNPERERKYDHSDPKRHQCQTLSTLF